MIANNLNPILLHEPLLPSFASLRERNLRTLYGDIKISEYINNDKSPKGSVDEKIRPLVNLINLHPEFVTLSSCSGRVAMFDPAGCDNSEGEITRDEIDNTTTTQPKVKGTEISGKGRGKWIFVTHDILPDLGERLIDSLKLAGKQRSLTDTSNAYITFKHEPPLLHIAASSLSAGKKLLHLAKSTCAMRESGLVVTDQRVTVEIRTTGTLLSLPLMVHSDVIQPNEEYLKTLASIANKRMEQNTILLDKLAHTIQSELFEASNNFSEEDTQFNVSFEPLPSLNLWKFASVAISSRSHSGETIDHSEILAFGGQGIGPTVDESTTTAPSSRRWDAIFQLSRENGAWAKSWKRLSTTTKVDAKTITLETSAGSFEVSCKATLGAREAHTACVLPQITSCFVSRDDGVVIFGGRTGGPMSPSNDLFLFKLQDNDRGVIGKPVDVRGSHPIPRFGHSMNALASKQSDDIIPLAVVSGGHSGKVALSCVFILSRSLNSDTGESHLLWAQIADMPLPRCYHSATILQINDCVDELFVFGGMSEPDDPFSSPRKFSCKLPIQRDNNCASIDITISDGYKVPESIGAAVCSCSMPPDKPALMLLSGGVQVQDSSDMSDDETPFHIINWKLAANGTVLRPERAQYSVTGREQELDHGTLTHHNILNLPCSKNGTISAVLVGGGVPSFSFGQSYAR